MQRLPTARADLLRPKISCRADFVFDRSLGLGGGKQCQLGGYSQVASWAGCSGTVIQMAMPSAGVLPGGLYTCLAGSATETDPSRQRPGLQDPYNRPGELVAMQLDGSRLSCRVLDGHKVAHNDGRVMRSTVSCVVHSDTNSAYFTGGFDGTVAVWSDDQMSMLARLPTHGCSINAVAADSRSYGLLYGTAKGELVWCSDPLGSAPQPPPLHKLSGPRLVDGQPSPLANSVDMVAVSGRGGRSHAYAGYGYLTAIRTGAVHAYDLAAMQAVDTIKLPHERALTDMAISPSEHLLAAVTGILLDEKCSAGDGIVRLYDLRAPGSPKAISTAQTDIHRVAFSPCGELIYSNDAGTGLMLVHDLRFASRPLWSHKHSRPTDNDHFMGFSWLPHNLAGLPAGLLMTGGNDHNLSMWDLRRSDSLIEQHDVGQPINNIMVSPDATHIWAGTEFGSIHLLSKCTGIAAFGENMQISYAKPEESQSTTLSS